MATFTARYGDPSNPPKAPHLNFALPSIGAQFAYSRSDDRRANLISEKGAEIAIQAINQRVQQLDETKAKRQEELLAGRLRLQQTETALATLLQKVDSYRKTVLDSERKLRGTREEISSLERDLRVLQPDSVAAMEIDKGNSSKRERADPSPVDKRPAKKLKTAELLAKIYKPGTQVYYKQKVAVIKESLGPQTFSIIQDNKEIRVDKQELVFFPQEKGIYLIRDTKNDRFRRYYAAEIQKIKLPENGFGSKCINLEIRWIDFEITEQRFLSSLDSLLPITPDDPIAQQLKSEAVEGKDRKKIGTGYYLTLKPESEEEI